MLRARQQIVRLTRSLIAIVFVFTGTVVSTSARGATDRSPDAALAELLDEARAEIPAVCSAAHEDRLVRALCAKRIRVGVRSNYPNFATRDGDTWHGYEIDLARAIASKLGIAAELVTATPANRLALLAEDRVDLAIATIGHNTQRDGQARFIRPHYYQSETVLVGPRGLVINSWVGVAGQTVCVTVGNGSNAELSSHRARLMLFDGPGQLLDGLGAGTCSLVAQDDSFFAASFAQPDFAALYASKFGFAPIPWGMAVARDGTERLAHALSLITQIFHRDGILLDLARSNHIATGFLAAQQEVWRETGCALATGGTDAACILPPLDTELEPTSFADRVSAFEELFSSRTGLELSLPMLKTVPAWSLLQAGVINSLVLVAGTIIATLAVALAFGALLSLRTRLLRWPVNLIVVVLQSSPPIMTLVITAAIVNAVSRYSSTASLAAAIAALGLINGANAGQAISEAVFTLRAETHFGPRSERDLFIRGLHRSSRQIESFLINATKGTPIASFIGTPELLNALTDISSFSRERVTTYWLLLIFYIVVVMVVVRLCALFRLLLDQPGVRA